MQIRQLVIIALLIINGSLVAQRDSVSITLFCKRSLINETGFPIINNEFIVMMSLLNDTLNIQLFPRFSDSSEIYKKIVYLSGQHTHKTTAFKIKIGRQDFEYSKSIVVNSGDYAYYFEKRRNPFTFKLIKITPR